jgi:hypothetical protein
VPQFPEDCLRIESNGPTISPASVLAFVLGMGLTFGVWAAAPAVIGRRAPWEGSWPYYSTALIGGSLFVGLVLPRRYGAVFAGAVVGQILAKLVLLEWDQRFMLTSRYDWVGALLTFPGSWLGSIVRERLRRAA